MRDIFSRLVVAFLLTAYRPFLVGQASHQVQANRPQEYTFAIVRVFPHDTTAFTQGLAYRDGFLYEGTGLIDLCISNRHHERKKEGSLEAVTKESRMCCRFRASVLSWQSVSINSSRLSGRPFASSCLRWRHTHSSGFSSGV